MTGERHAAFTKVRDHISGIAAAKLFDHERELLDSAAEDLLLSRSVAEALEARELAVATLDALVQSGRWTARMRDYVLGLLEACGPQQQLIGSV